jgi:hypothetical protein
MTSYQPGEPPYTAPQDPWSSAPGVASPPTDPIPQAPRGGFTPGVASPVPPPASVWSQETIAHDDRYRRSPGGRTGLYILVTIIVLVLGGAGGFGAWYLITDRMCPGSQPCTTGSQQPTNPTEDTFHPEAVRLQDCLVNHGTETDAKMKVESCDTAGALRVLSIVQGEDIPENAQGKFDRNTTAVPLCGGVQGWDGSWFGWNSSNDRLDFFYCLDNLG